MVKPRCVMLKTVVSAEACAPSSLPVTTTPPTLLYIGYWPTSLARRSRQPTRDARSTGGSGCCPHEHWSRDPAFRYTPEPLTHTLHIAAARLVSSPADDCRDNRGRGPARYRRLRAGALRVDGTRPSGGRRAL